MACAGCPWPRSSFLQTAPWSPFADDVVLIRPFAGARPLRNDNSSESLGGGLTLSGRIGDWQTNFSANYSRSWTDSLLDRGIDMGGCRT